MNNSETRRLAMLVRVSDFGKAHGDVFTESTDGAGEFARVADAVAKLSEYGRSKIATSREGLRAKSAARAALLERLDVISRAARAIAEVTPGFDEPFHLSPWQNERALLMSAQVYADEAEQRKARFMRQGLPDAFVADVRQLLDRFAQAVHEREEARSARVAAQRGIDGAMDSALTAIRQLDNIVPNLLAHDEGALGQWEDARRISYSSRRKARASSRQPAPVAPSQPEAGAGQPKAGAGQPKEESVKEDVPVGVGT